MKRLVVSIISMMLLGTMLLAKENIYNRMLYKAVHDKDINKIDLYLKKGADISSLSHNILPSSSLKIIKHLVKKGYKISENEEDCILAQVMDSNRDSNDIYEKVKFLINNGANPTCKEKDSFKASVIESIVKNIYNPSNIKIKAFEYIVKNARDDINYHSPLNKVLTNYNYNRINEDTSIKIIKILIKNGANINEKFVYNERKGRTTTPLISAINHNSLDTVKLLLKNGADINQIISSGESPVDRAYNNKYEDIELFLVEQGAKYHKHSNLN